MDFIEIAVENIDGESAEAVGDVFQRYGYGGAVMEMVPPNLDLVTVRTVIPAEDDDVLQKTQIALALMGKVLPKGLPEPKLKFIGKNDWAESWKENFHVVKIGARVVIKPSWREYTPQGNEVVVHLDPGMAFGSGLHPTTSLCLQILQEMPLAGVDMFDVGTGSGILSVAAAKLGAAPIRAVDVDPIAVKVAQENFALNQLPAIGSAIGSARDTGGRLWKLVVANILSSILIEIMDDLLAATTADGRLILSGIINEQEQLMLDCLAAHQLVIEERRVEGDWIAFVVKK